MKNLTPQIALLFRFLSIIFLAFSISACSAFKKGYGLMTNGKDREAKEIFEDIADDQKPYGPGADYYERALGIYQQHTTDEWQETHNRFFELQEIVKEAPIKQKRKLHRYEVTIGRIEKTAAKLEKHILQEMCTRGTITELETLYDNFPHWMSEAARDSVRDIIVNRTINPNVKVYDKDDCKNWEASGEEPPTVEQVMTEKGRSCSSLTLRDSWQITYHDATRIGQRFSEAILPANYGQFWNMQAHIWDIFLIHESFCEMDRFKQDYPTHALARDCWFDEARDTLCMSALQPLLAFHRNNPHTALDIDICQQVLCLAIKPRSNSELSSLEKQQVKDIELMIRLRRELACPTYELDSEQVIADVAYLAENYQHHRLVFEIGQRACLYFAGKGELAAANKALDTFIPLFPDKSVCATNFQFQVGKQKWFETFDGLLQRANEKLMLPEPVVEWNTPDHDEYALISWGETNEAFFVRKNRQSGIAKVMTSKLENGVWETPVVVSELSIANDVQLLSIGAQGRFMLLKSGGKLMQAQRYNINRRWSEPGALPAKSVPGGRAMLSADGTMLLQENYVRQTDLLLEPETDIFISLLGKDGRYEEGQPLNEKINEWGFSEKAPFLALQGRLLFYSSDRPHGLGYQDMYSVSLDIPYDWTTAGEPVNLGLGVNSIYDDQGLTFFSEYTGKGYFDRRSRCNNDSDIWFIQMEKQVFPQNTMRFAGLVLDENKKPISGGFMEFTTDYNLRTNHQPISSRGTYTYTAPDSSAVVRLFPEVAGYYSEFDRKHFLANKPKGVIIRDTFLLTSFEYIRKYFKLKHSTFVAGTAQFSNPNQTYPELTRLAKIATRMGAELDLIGHTDDVGSEGANDQLSHDRAQSVKQFLVDKCGFNPKKITVQGKGNKEPICQENTEECRRINRRIEVKFRMPELPGEQTVAKPKVVSAGTK